MHFSSAVMILGAALAAARPQSQSVNPTQASAAANSATPTVTLDYCTVVPTAGNASLGYYKYQNIRFAAAPTGTLRWDKPQWPVQETGVNDGSLASSSVTCSSTEDCLFADVWAPADSAGKKLPVMVWTYGGGFTGGSKSENTPEGLFNLTKDFVFVAYNYRLGLTGLANGPTFLHAGGISNTALWDVQHAFEWTKKYISQFGGDPEQITAVGFSAGASQTLFQMTRFAGHAPQLYNRAYVMSPGFVPGAGHQHAEEFWQNVSTAVGCPGGSLTCMRQVPFTNLTSTATSLVSKYNYQFQPRVDGDFVADTYEAQFYQNRFNFTGPLVLSHEQHEANSQSYSGVNTTADVSKYLRIFFPAITDTAVDEALSLYPESDYTSPGLRFADMKQSFDLTAHNLAATHAMNNGTWNAMVALGAATHGTDQSYYWYNAGASLTPQTTSSSMGGGSTNSSSNSTTTTGPPGTSSSNSTSTSGPSGMGGMGGGMGSSSSVNATTATTMQKYLLSFILTGNPNTMWPTEKPNWPLYNSSSSGVQLVFNDSMYTTTDDLANARSLFWNKALWY